jgi:hypothetical protein
MTAAEALALQPGDRVACDEEHYAVVDRIGHSIELEREWIDPETGEKPHIRLNTIDLADFTKVEVAR